MTSLKDDRLIFTRSGLAYTTTIRKTRNTLFCTIPKDICVGCDLKKGQKLINHVVWWGDKLGLFVELGE